MAFFRRCLERRRRLYLKLVTKIPLHLERESGWDPSDEMSGAVIARGLFDRETGKPVVLDVEEVQYNYKCASCGHEGSEKPAETDKEQGAYDLSQSLDF